MRKNIAEFHALQSLNEVRPAQEPRTVDVDFLEHLLDARGQLLARPPFHADSYPVAAATRGNKERNDP